MLLKVSTIVLLATAFTINAEDTASCDKTAVYNSLRNMRKDFQLAKSTNQSEAFNLYNAMTTFEDAGAVIESTIAHCPESEKKQLKALLQLVLGLIADDGQRVKTSIELIDDEQLIEEFVGLFYALDYATIVNFIINAPPEMSSPFSKAFMTLLERTNLNNTEIIPKVELINFLNVGIKIAIDDSTSSNNKKLLKQAIKTNLILQQDNIEQLYKINEEITKKVIKELIAIYVLEKIESHQQLSLYPLFLIIKCSSNSDIWIDNLNLVFESLKSNDKLNSIQSLMLLKEVDGLLEHYPENKVLLNIKSAIPDSTKKVLQGYVCVKAEDINKPINIFLIISNRFTVTKFVPNEEGSYSLITASAGNFNFSFVVNATEGVTDFTKHHTVQTQKGDLEKFTGQEFCINKEEIAFHGCVPLEKVLPTGGAKVLHLGFVKQVTRYTDIVLVDSANESCSQIDNEA